MVSNSRNILHIRPAALTLYQGLRLRLQRRRQALPACNMVDEGAAPRMLEGFETEVDKDGWRNSGPRPGSAIQAGWVH
jgi:hypothetical protein